MAWPHPIVGVAAKLAYVARRRSHKADISKYFIHIHKVLIAIVKRLYHRSVMSVLHSLFFNLLDVAFNHLLTFLFAHCVFNSFQYLGGYVFHIDQQRNCQALARKLRLLVRSPKAVCQIVCLDRAVRNNVAVSAVMIGQKQTFGRHKLSRATASEQNNCIFERRMIDAVNVVGTNSHAVLLHICLPLSD